jgi:hypothetical protein
MGMFPARPIAFSSEVGTGSHEENASNQNLRAPLPIPSKAEGLSWSEPALGYSAQWRDLKSPSTLTPDSTLKTDLSSSLIEDDLVRNWVGTNPLRRREAGGNVKNRITVR